MPWFEKMMVASPVAFIRRSFASVVFMTKRGSMAKFFGSKPCEQGSGFSRIFSLMTALLVALHVAAFVCLFLTEYGPLAQSLALLGWGLSNCLLLLLLRRPALSAALSLALIVIVILVSRFKFGVTWMTITFLDILIVDSDSFAFLLNIIPDLRMPLLIAAALGVPAAILLWSFDPYRVRRRVALAGAGLCLTGLATLSAIYPEQPWEPFQGVNHVSNFSRSAVLSVSELTTKGWLEIDSAVADPTGELSEHVCQPASRPPHIIMVLDESSFDIRAAPGIKVPPGYADHFRSFDGRERLLLTEATGGPTWYTEYNVLTGLSARSFGRLKFYVTRIAAGRVERGLPQALRRCGYRTFSLYPAYGAFLSARRFQKSAGIDRLFDAADMGAGDLEPDSFFYDKALNLIGRERESAPLFVFVYTMANHFPWTTSFRPDLTPDWRPLGNTADVDEYLRRQSMSARDYTDFTERLRRQFPDEKFLIVRFGDHPPALSHRIMDPALNDSEIAQKVMNYDPDFYSTYYVIDTVNFAPAALTTARMRLDAPYLPLVVQEAAGLPLDSTFREQKQILERCDGVFYACKDGAEASRFNRLLMDAGLLKGF